MDEIEAYWFVAKWHRGQARLFRDMSRDEPRISKELRDKALAASIHHDGSATALENKAADLRRTKILGGSM